MSTKYKHKPTEVDAIQLTPETFDACLEFIGDTRQSDGTSKDECFIGIETDEGDRSIRSGDYIIRGVLGVVYPCSEVVFKESYEEVQA